MGPASAGMASESVTEPGPAAAAAPAPAAAGVRGAVTVPGEVTTGGDEVGEVTMRSAVQVTSKRDELSRSPAVTELMASPLPLNWPIYRAPTHSLTDLPGLHNHRHNTALQ